MKIIMQNKILFAPSKCLCLLFFIVYVFWGFYLIYTILLITTHMNENAPIQMPCMIF